MKRSHPSAIFPLLRELVEVLHKRQHGAVKSLNVSVRGVDHVILVRRMRPAAVAAAEGAGGEFERLARKDVTRIGAGDARPEHRLNAGPLQNGHLRLDQW